MTTDETITAQAEADTERASEAIEDLESIASNLSAMSALLMQLALAEDAELGTDGALALYSVANSMTREKEALEAAIEKLA